MLLILFTFNIVNQIIQREWNEIPDDKTSRNYFNRNQIHFFNLISEALLRIVFGIEWFIIIFEIIKIIWHYILLQEEHF